MKELIECYILNFFIYKLKNSKKLFLGEFDIDLSNFIKESNIQNI